MSITVLNQVYDEARRLAVAGSAVARGDFRLKKLLPPLDQAAAKAPVFAKVAEAARAVVDGPEEAVAAGLLELAALVTAVLYTQGETGVAGPVEPIETTDLGGTATQASARLLKPLMEALTSTGSGRLELIRDAHQRRAFRDLRLVMPALGGVDDPYPEIADFLVETVLPMYGRAILPQLRAAYDPKGGRGHARRLKLMHQLDPAGSRDLVTQALEDGSKEVRVAAVECLGGAPEDLSYLIEQVSAKAKEVRAAAYRALAAMDDPAAADVLKAAIAGKDIDLAAAAIARSKNDNLPGLLIAEIIEARTAFPKLKDKQQVSEAAGRLCSLIAALPDHEHP
ncbi:MAG TPA: HEAT repeat domain-containing protein, partial [Gemmataceae bacterium]